ncbi:MAG: polysaccharide biosynthesis/export family protein [Bacteroidales bacterium]|nr:polysaccharide biosynthesis/export family protein [Bacteroidales bacterium]
MRKKMNIFKLGLLVLIGGILMTSCVPQKKIKYLQSAQYADSIPTVRNFTNPNELEYRVQAGDNLYVKINTDKKTGELFGDYGQSQNNYLNSDASIYLNSYTVDATGEITLPVVEKVSVKDQTIEEIRATLEAAIKEYVVDATVFVKLVNFKITILGEVYRPGTFKIYQDRITIWDAIGMAGDITDFANRGSVNLIRTTDKGNKVCKIDLTSDQLLSSEFYYLMPNDVIYVEPLEIKQFGFQSFPYSLLFSVVSTTILILTYLK